MKKVKRVRPILQMERTECGAASLAMILAYYGKHVTLEEMRQDCSVSRNGVNAKNIVLAAELHGLSAKPVRVEAEDAEGIELPAIIHWNMDHFVVLCGFGKMGIVIVDPADGTRTVSYEEFNRSFTGIAIELKPDDSFKKEASHRKKEYYIYSCLKRYTPAAVYLAVNELIVMLGTISILFLNSIFIDKILIAGNYRNLNIIIEVILAAGMLSVGAMIINVRTKKRIGKLLNIDINTGFMEHILRLPIEFFKNRNEGDLANRQNATMYMGMEFAQRLLPIPASILQILIYLLLVFIFNLNAAILSIVCTCINIGAMLVASKNYNEKILPYTRDVGKLQGEIANVADRIETIKACGAEEGAFMRLMSIGTKIANERIVTEKSGIFIENLFAYMNAISLGVILISGIFRIFQGEITTGMLIAAQAVVAALMIPVGSIVNTEAEIQTLIGEAQRTDDVMNYRESRKFLDDAGTQRGEIKGEVELKEVTFRYNALDEPAVDNFSMRLEKGQTVALTGMTGCGKSTVAKLIAGIYSPQSGQISFDGMELNEIDHSYFYSKIAMVNQRANLFEGSVADNITMWDNSISYSDITAAAKAACIHEDIINRKNGYNETVQSGGANFSGGQRQRIEIARALVKKPAVIVLDEATSALDNVTESKVMKNIRALGITCIIVAHRLSAIIESDEIIVLENGVIKERGTHRSLMEKKGMYYRLRRSEG